MISGELLANPFPSGLLETLLVEKVQKRGTPGGAGHAIRTRLRMFYEGRPVWQKVTSETALGGHLWDFGSILGALREHFAHFLTPLRPPVAAQDFQCDF